MGEKIPERGVETNHRRARRSLFTTMEPKASFLFGLFSGIAAMSLIGFLITAMLILRDKEDATAKATGAVAGATVPQPAAANNEPAVNPDAVRPVDDADHVRGAKNATITLIEYSDFQCPFCQRAHPTMSQLLEQYDGKLRWVYRHFPLESIHPQARPAAIASECIADLAGEDGFWKFADQAYENQTQLGAEFFKSVAADLGVNAAKFETCLGQKEFDAIVQKDADEGLAAGVQGTPTTFINGTPISGALPIEQFKSVIDGLLAG